MLDTYTNVGASAAANTVSRMVLVVCCVAALTLFTAVLFKLHDEIRYPSSDTGSYVEIARQVRAGNYSALKNPYWSPAYPALLSLFIPTDSSPARDKAGLILSQWILLCGVVLSFAYLCAQISKLPTELGQQLATLVLCVGFLFGVAFHIKMYVPTYTPDTLVSIVVFLALGLACRLPDLEAGIGLYVLFGAILATGYYAKAAMFPSSLLLLGLMAFTHWHKRRSLVPIGVATATFFALSMPLIVVISTSLGRFSLGEVGRLNYAWHVNGYEAHLGWVGAEPGSGTPLHPPRIISTKPYILEFADPGGGTFPLWYNPARWHEGMRLQFSVGQLLGNIKRQLSTIGRAVLLWFALPIMAVLTSGCVSSTVRRMAFEYSAVCLWPILFIASYCLIAAETRYIVPLVAALILVLLWLWPFQTLPSRLALAGQLVVLTAGSAFMLYTTAFMKKESTVHESKWTYEAAVENYCRSHGVKKGDTLAIVGIRDIFFAQHLGTQIVSWWKRKQPLDQNTPEIWSRAEEIWRRLGIKAILYSCRDKNDAIDTVANGTASCYPEIPASAGFEQVPGTHYFVKVLQPR